MPQCGYFVQPDRPERLILDGPLLPGDWTVELNYLANSDGSMALALSDGPERKVPVHPGLNRVYARLPGAGDAITVRANTTALSLCIGRRRWDFWHRPDLNAGRHSRSNVAAARIRPSVVVR